MRLTQVTQLLALFLSVSVVAQAQGNSFNKIRYQGGTLQTKVKPDDWGNRLTVTSDEIRFDMKDGQIYRIDPKRVTGLSYGQEAHRRVGTMIALGILLAPLALFGLFHKTRLHYVGVEFTTAEDKKSGLLLQAHKDNYRAVLLALRGATGAPISVAESERKYVPATIETVVAPDVSPANSERADNKKDITGTLKISAAVEGAEIKVDGSFVGNTPAQLKLPAGKHRIEVVSEGYEQWVKEIEVLAGSELTLNATLKKKS